ncbi:type I restriction enzyme HsdR protein N-terminal domain protein [Prevotella amnii CRIS 21A-A]|uniref:Type I restriction enzyme HsdR protein N-terminal domain protein n=1 Tax=Prevotella amnii CRIS 21A-A TaxID=679191 RepID=E1GX64_9BACT|nr:type I restriction enzyme HsdR N-terminal domain-containing protein [Prevotella amnii]EFN90751.1 type I restriction enzyme HsdR protein N-terminal domain protein [Prevotella amnii CRIS 21A-A]
MKANFLYKDLSIKEHNGRRYVLDILRRKYIALTPEEWVRQSFIRFVVEKKNYPQALLANEISLNLGNKKLRADSVLYDKMLKPRMIIEYKAPKISITQRVFDQIFSYNILLSVPYIIVTNGIEIYVCKLNEKEKRYMFLDDIPYYEEL